MINYLESITFEGDSVLVRYRDGGFKTLSMQDSETFDIFSSMWLRCGWDTKYVYGFSWLGRPIIQLPEDMIRIQELIWEYKPDLVIETGVAHGGGLVFYASIMNCYGEPRVIGIDISIRQHNRNAIEEHALAKHITLIERSSTSPKALEEVVDLSGCRDRIIVILDANHSKEHVLEELQLYGDILKAGDYIVACDGIMKYLRGAPRSGDDWETNNPVDAVREFLAVNPRFELCERKPVFNEGAVSNFVTYWPEAYIRKRDVES